MYPHAVLRRRRRADRVTFVNLVSEPENFGAWQIPGGSVVTGGQEDPFGGTDAFLIEDNSGTATGRVEIEFSFTGDGSKGFSLFVREGSSPPAEGTRISVFDLIGTNNGQVDVGWSNGTPVILNSVSAENVSFVTYPGGWHRMLATANNMVDLNAYEYRLVIAPGGAANTGNIFVFGATVHDEPTPGAYERA